MAKKSSNIDITKAGPQSYRDLQKQNAEAFQQASASSPFAALQPSRSYASSLDMIYEGEEASPLQQAGQTPWGESTYDAPSANEADYQANLGNRRGEEQPWYAQLGAGITKGVALAGTTFLDGTIGLLTGVATAIEEGRWSGLWDNAVSNATAKLNRELEEVLPNYRTAEEEQNPWYKNLGTMNFWADGVIKNLGFTVGAFYSGSAWTKGLQAIGALRGAMGAKTVGSLLSAVNEGRIEANNNAHDFLELENTKIKDAANLKRQEIEESALSEEDKLMQLAQVDQQEENLMANAKDRADAMGLTTLIGNTVLLSLDNFAEFGKLYARGFKNSKGLASNMTKAGKEIAQEEAGKNLTREAGKYGKYAWEDISKTEAVAKGLKNGLLEGNEEMSQAFIAEAAGNMQTPDSPDAYYEALTDPKATMETKDFLTSVTEGLVNTYGNGDRWEEFAIGAFTGLLGMPTFGKVANSDSNTYLGKGKMIGLSGGLFGEIRDANRRNKEGRETAEAMNKYVDKMRDHSRHFVQSQAFSNAMDGWSAEDDAFEYKNAEDNDDFAALARFARAGRLNDLKEMVNDSFEDLSDEELATIAQTTTPDVEMGIDGTVKTDDEEGTTKQGGWRNTDGTLMSDTEKGRQKMRDELEKKRKKILKEINRYEDSVERARAIANGSLSEDQIVELGWLDWKVNTFKERYKSIKEDNQEFINDLDDGINEYMESHADDVIDTESEEGKKLRKAMENTRLFLNALRKAKNPLQLAAIMEANPAIADFLEDLGYEMLEDRGVIFTDEETFDRSMTALRDAVKLAKATKSFNQRYREFKQDPLALQRNREKIDKKKEETRKASAGATARDKVNNASVSEMVQAAEDGDLDLDEMADMFSDEDDEFLNNIDPSNPHAAASGNTEGTAGPATTPSSGKKKVEEAKKIVRTSKRMGDAITGLRQEGVTQEAIDDAQTLLNASKSVSESEQELLDTATQAYNDPSLLYDEEDPTMQGVSQAELESVLGERLDIAKSVIEQAKAILEEEDGELEDLPEGGTVKRTLGGEYVKKGQAAQGATGAQTGGTAQQGGTQEQQQNTQGAQGTQGGPTQATQGSAPEAQGAQGTPQGETPPAATTSGASETTAGTSNTSGTSATAETTGHDATSTVKSENQRQKEAEAAQKEQQKKAEEQAKINEFFKEVRDSVPEESREAFDTALTDVLRAIDFLMKTPIEDKAIGDLVKQNTSYQTLSGLAPNINDYLNVYVSHKRAAAKKAQGAQGAQEGNTGGGTQESQQPKEERIPTPTLPEVAVRSQITSESKRDPNRGELTDDYQYWKPNTAYLPFGSLYRKGDFTPFYKVARRATKPDGKTPLFTEAQLKRIEAVGAYLEKAGTFKLVDSGAVKAGKTKVSFFIDKQLNEDAGEIIILMKDEQGRIIGDLASLNDPSTANQAALIPFMRRVIAAYEEAGSPQTFDFSETTVVDKNMVGKVPYLGDYTILNTLNDIHMDGNNPIPFTLGIALTDGKNARIYMTPGRTKNQGQSAEERTINPPLNAVKGQPYLLMPTSSAKNHYMPVPITMPAYGLDTQNTLLGKAIRKVLERIATSNNDNVINVINALEELLSVQELHINYTDEKVKITVKAHGAEHQRTIYNGPANAPNLVSSLEAGLQGLPFQVSRKYINGTYEGQDYNRMIGEIAQTNLAVGSTHTISDWFTIKPLDAAGKPMKTSSPRTTGENPYAAQIPQIPVSIGGQQFEVDSKKYTVTKNGVPYSGADVNLIKARAFGFHTNKNMERPYRTQWGYYDPVANKFVEEPPTVKRTLTVPGVSSSGGTQASTQAGTTDTKEEDRFSAGENLPEAEKARIKRESLAKAEAGLGWHPGDIIVEESSGKKMRVVGYRWDEAESPFRTYYGNEGLYGEPMVTLEPLDGGTRISQFAGTTKNSIETGRKKYTKTYDASGLGTAVHIRIPGKMMMSQTYYVDKENHIYTYRGEEVFKEDGPDRNKIFANLAVQEGRAKVVTYEGRQYVVNKKGDIIEVATGNKIQLPENDPTREAIVNLAYGTQQSSTPKTPGPIADMVARHFGGYFEGGGAVLEDDYPNVPEALVRKLENYIMSGLMEEASSQEPLTEEEAREFLEKSEPGLIPQGTAPIPRGFSLRTVNGEQYVRAETLNEMTGSTELIYYGLDDKGLLETATFPADDEPKVLSGEQSLIWGLMPDMTYQSGPLREVADYLRSIPKKGKKEEKKEVTSKKKLSSSKVARPKGTHIETVRGEEYIAIQSESNDIDLTTCYRLNSDGDLEALTFWSNELDNMNNDTSFPLNWVLASNPNSPHAVEIKAYLNQVEGTTSPTQTTTQTTPQNAPQESSQPQSTQGTQGTQAEQGTQGNTEEETPEQLRELAKSKGLISTPVRQAVWEALTPQQQAIIAHKKGPKQKQWMLALEKAYDPKTKKFDETRLKGTVDEFLGRKGLYRETDGSRRVWNKERELGWMKKVLPNLSTKEHLTIVEGFIRINDSDHPGYAYGKFQEGLITISDLAARGTVYHEAFHAVVHTLLNEDEYNKLFKAATDRWGNIDRIQLEENMAEDFRRFMQSEEDWYDSLDAKGYGPIRKAFAILFHNLKNRIKELSGKTPYMNRLYYSINRGKYARKQVNQGSPIRYMMAPGFRGTISEFQDILDSVLNNPYLRLSRAAKNNKWGRLADYWRTQGYDVKGYYEKGKWIVASARKLDDPYYRRVDEVVTNNEAEFKRDITRFLGNFGITLKDVSEYDGEEPLFDAINKVIHFSSVEDLTDEVGYAIAFMMQRQPAITEILSTYVAFNGNEKGLKRGIKRGTLGKTKAIKLDKMTPEARQHLLRLVGKDISAELRKLYGIGEEKPSFMKKIWEAIAAFFERLTPYNRLRFDAIHNYARHVANSVKLNDKSIIISGMVKPKTSSPAERVDIAKALRENPYEEQIISTLSDYGIGLAGSASMAAVGTLYRPKENPLHDIDFMSPGMDKEKLMAILDKEYPHYIHIRSINNDGNITETFMIMDRDFTMKEVSQAEGFKSLKEIYDSEGNKIGTLTGSDLILNEGVQGKLLDFFTGPSRFGGRIVTLNGKAYFMSDYRNAIAAKVDWVRLKDVWDYNRFILNENIVTTPDIYEGNAVISERIKKAHIIWGHPALGKTTYIEQHRDSILEWDEEVNEKRFEFIRQQIDPEGKLEEAEFNARKREYMRDWKNHPEYIAFLTREWKALKERAAREHKKIFASPLPLLALFEEDFDLMVNLTNYEFLRRNQERQAGDYYSSLSWKEAVDEVLTRVNPSKVVLTNKYFNEVMSEATSQQIQQYHRDKLMYANLSQEDKDYIAERGITIEEYNRMTQVEKEVLFRCKY